MTDMTDEGLPRLQKQRHVKYWLRCLKTLLPSMYTSNDSNRMYLAYFILSACDILDILTSSTLPAERQDWIDWIYHCQHPNGGFRMWPGTDFGERANDDNAKWDPANVNATYFALTSLLILGDDLKRVNRKETLRWIWTMQRDDGSFGETLVAKKLEGGRDPRLGYCATGVRHILRGNTKEGPMNFNGQAVNDIDFDEYVECLRRSETFDGGIADAPFHEPQAGYTFCTLGSLAFMSRLEPGHVLRARPRHGPSCPPDVVRWLLSLQTDFVDPEVFPANDLSAASPTSKANTADGPGEGPENQASNKSDQMLQPKAIQQNQKQPSSNLHQSPDRSTMWGSGNSTPLDPTLIESTCPTPDPNHSQGPKTHSFPSGISGRPSKPADTCYAWWAGASLHLLQQSHLASTPALRHYLLALTQHPVMGGFSKFPGDKWADLYHSYLGLAALSLVSTPAEREADGIKEVDAGMCVSAEVRVRLGGVWEGFEY